MKPTPKPPHPLKIKLFRLLYRPFTILFPTNFILEQIFDYSKVDINHFNLLRTHKCGAIIFRMRRTVFNLPLDAMQYTFGSRVNLDDAPANYYHLPEGMCFLQMYEKDNPELGVGRGRLERPVIKDGGIVEFINDPDKPMPRKKI